VEGGYLQVTRAAFETQIIRDAGERTDSRLGATKIEDALRLVVSQSTNTINITIPGLPNSRDVIAVVVPFLLLYAAFSLSSAVRRRVTTSADFGIETKYEPWMLLNAETIPEIILALVACLALILAVVCVIWMTLLADAQLNVRFLDYEHYVSNDPYYLVRRTWLSDLHDSSRESGTPYLERFPWFGAIRLLACGAALYAIVNVDRDLMKSYLADNRRFRRANLWWRLTLRELRLSIRPAIKWSKLNIFNNVFIITKAVAHWIFSCATNRWLSDTS
jgi:hypothetical protein